MEVGIKLDRPEGKFKEGYRGLVLRYDSINRWDKPFVYTDFCDVSLKKLIESLDFPNDSSPRTVFIPYSRHIVYQYGKRGQKVLARKNIKEGKVYSLNSSKVVPVFIPKQYIHRPQGSPLGTAKNRAILNS